MSWKTWAMCLILSALLGYLLHGAVTAAAHDISAEYNRYDDQSYILKK